MNLLFKKIFCTTLVSSFLLFSADAQQIKKFSSKSYSVAEGLLSNQVKDMAEDENGLLWISTGVGLQRFDGLNFETITPHAGLPQTNHIYFFKLKDGNLWLCYQDKISIYNRFTDKFKLLYSLSGELNGNMRQANLSAIPFIKPFVEINENVWCWNELDKKFICINKHSGNITDSLFVPVTLQPNLYNKTSDNTIIFGAISKAIVHIDFKEKRIKHIVHFPESFSEIDYTLISDTALIITTKKGLYKTNIITGVTKFLTEYPAYILKNIINTSLIHLHDSLYALRLNKEVFIFNAQSGKIIHRMVNPQNDVFVNPGYIRNLFLDSFNHLWIISGAEGLKKINLNNLAIKYYGVGPLPDNFNRCIYADKEANLIITGSLFNGFSVYDTSQRLIKQFKLSPQEQTSCILKIKPYNYLLFTDGEPGVYLFNSKNFQFTILSKKFTQSFVPNAINYSSYIQPVTDSTALLFCPFSIFVISYSKNNIDFKRISIRKDFSSAIADHKKRLWVGDAGNYAILSGNNYEEEKSFPLIENLVSKCFYQDDEKNMWLGTEKGLYKLNGETGDIIHIYKKKDGLANDFIYSIISDDKGNIWCATNKGISCIYKNGKIINIYSSDGLQGDEFNTNSYAKAADGELFFGGVNGVSSFYPDNMKSLSELSKIFMTDIKVMDRDWNSDTAASWNVQQIKLPYTNNILSFTFIALGRYSPDLYNYQYKMTGIDKDWVNGGNKGFARYVLPPGKYVFEYTAGIRPGDNLDYKKSIAIVILPPFWQTGWFYILIVICVLAALIAGVNFYIKIKHRKKIREIEIEKTVQQERQRISRDLHDNIGAYATVLMASTEQLKMQTSEAVIQQSAENLSHNAQDIMSSLRETIWVLNNDVITISDFIDRFKLYAKKMLQNFADVQIKFKEKLDKDFKLSPAEALHLFRIMQEALQNTIKHAKPQNIIVSVESNKSIRISIKDDGKGFDKNNITNGNGLLNMQHRANEAGYQLNILSTEAGTEVTLQKNTSFAV